MRAKLIILVCLAGLFGCVSSYFPPSIENYSGASPLTRSNSAYLGSIEWGIHVNEIDGQSIKLARIVAIDPGRHTVKFRFSGASASPKLTAYWGDYRSEINMEAGKAYEVVAKLDAKNSTVSFYIHEQPEGFPIQCLFTHRANFYSPEKFSEMKVCALYKETSRSTSEERMPLMKNLKPLKAVFLN